MNKKLLGLLTCAMFLSGCNEDASGSSKSNKELGTAAEIVNVTHIDLAVDELYSLFSMLKDDFKNQIVTIDESNNPYCYADPDIGILKGLKIGTTTIRVRSSDYYQDVEIKVSDDAYVNSHFVVDRGRLYQKKAIFFGDSITDNDVNIRPQLPIYHTGFDYYPGKLRDEVPLADMHDYAISGATAAICPSIGTQINAAYQVQKAINEGTLAEADYVFVMFGTNDFMRCVPFGSIDDEPTTIEATTTFYGAYNYFYKKILEINPKVRIVALEITFSTWGQDSAYIYSPAGTYGTTRADYTGYVRNIVNKYGFISIPTWDLWDASNWSTYIPDGIHPANLGHIRLMHRILNEDLD